MRPICEIQFADFIHRPSIRSSARRRGFATVRTESGRRRWSFAPRTRRHRRWVVPLAIDRGLLHPRARTEGRGPSTPHDARAVEVAVRIRTRSCSSSRRRIRLIKGEWRGRKSCAIDRRVSRAWSRSQPVCLRHDASLRTAAAEPSPLKDRVEVVTCARWRPSIDRRSSSRCARRERL